MCHNQCFIWLFHGLLLVVRSERGAGRSQEGLRFAPDCALASHKGLDTPHPCSTLGQASSPVKGMAVVMMSSLYLTGFSEKEEKGTQLARRQNLLIPLFFTPLHLFLRFLTGCCIIETLSDFCSFRFLKETSSKTKTEEKAD